MNKLFVIPLLAIIFLSSCTTTPYTTTSSSSTPVQTSSSSQTSSASTSQSSSTSSSHQSVSVSIQSFAFSPKTLTIKAGDTVTWTNMDSASHTVTSDPGSSELGSGNLPNGQSYSHTFTQPGTYTYHCAIHPSMTATVIVQ